MIAIEAVLCAAAGRPRVTQVDKEAVEGNARANQAIESLIGPISAGPHNEVIQFGRIGPNGGRYRFNSLDRHKP
jgi:hypothetical protein